MPLQQDSAQRFGELLCVESEGLLVTSPTSGRLTDAGWKAAREMLQRQEDLTAVIVLLETSLLAKLFEESWNTLPCRLASLAICPPDAANLVVRSKESDRVLKQIHPVNDSLWRCLVEFARQEGARIEVRTELCLDEFVCKAICVDGSDEGWLPELLSAPPRRELEWLFGELHLARLSDLCGPVISPADATAVLAGLWLLHGDGDASHRHSQSIEDEGRHRCGNYWHAIMHRQEPDYGNSKYWFRRVGQHPIFPELARRATELIMADGSYLALHQRKKLGLPANWDPFAFVDWCEAASHAADLSQIRLIRRIQFVEMHLLLRASFADATRP